MISCTEFIWVYGELFRYIEERGGETALISFWKGIASEFLWNLRAAIEEDGLRGMHRYWSHTLGEEGGKWAMTLHEDMFVIDMHECPSAKKVFSGGRIAPYAKYCEHCRWLYPPMIREYGYEADYDIIDCKKGRCRLTVRRPEGADTPDRNREEAP
jgi:hypothetical protein